MALATSSVSGLISGLDTASIIQQMMAIESRPVTLLQQQIDAANAQKSALTTVNTSLLALKTAADELSRTSTWEAKQAAVSDPEVLSAAVSEATPAGTYTFTVAQLADATQLASNGYADSDTAPVGAGTFDVSVGGAYQGTITVDAADTLDDVAAAVNARDWGVSAVVVNTGSDYKLILSSDETGEANAATIANNTSGLSFAEITQAKNAVVQFGKDSPLTIESATNTVTGLAPGLTLDLKSVSASAVSVTVASDAAGILEKAQDFVAKYNAVMANIAKYTKYNEDTETAGVLLGNSTLRFLSTDLAVAVTSSVDGAPAETNSLQMVGFKMDRDGKLSLDEGVFTDALAAHPEGVTSLFAGLVDSALASEGASIATEAAPAAGFDAGDLINGNADADDFGSGNGFEAAAAELPDAFTVTFGAARQIAQFMIRTLSDGTGVSDFTLELQRPGGAWTEVKSVSGFSGGVYAYILPDPMSATAMRLTVTGTNAGDGKTRLVEIEAQEERGVGHRIGNLLGFVTRSGDGQIANEQTRLDEKISSLEDQIERLEERLLAREEQLRAQFTAMEEAMAQLQSQSTMFLSQLSSNG